MAQPARCWTVEEISFDIVHNLTDHPVATMLVLTPVGPLRFMAEPVVQGATPGRTPVKTIDATEALARRGLSMLRAKRLTEDLLEDRRVFAELPTVEHEQACISDMAGCGIGAVLIRRDVPVDMRALRERLNLTREQFAICCGLEVETLRNWETGKHDLIPPPAATCAPSPTHRKRLNRPTQRRWTGRHSDRKRRPCHDGACTHRRYSRPQVS